MASSCAQDRPTREASPGADGQAAAQAGGNFRFGQSGDITVLDPWNVTDGSSLLVTRQIFESLVAYEPTGFKIVPGVFAS